MSGVEVLLIFLLICVLVFFLVGKFERDSIFQPTNVEIWRPSVQYEEYDIQHKEEKIRIWEFKNYPSRNVVLFCHGNNGNISYREYVVNTCELHQINLVLFDYRGFGKSSGEFSQTNICDDALAVYRHVRKTYTPERIIIWGESLGGAPAAYLASKETCKGLVLFSTFTNLGELASRTEVFQKYVRMLAIGTKALYDGLPTIEWVKRVKCPVLVVHSLEDALIPFSCGYDLFNAVTHANKQILKIRGTHSAPIFTSEQLDILYSFVDKETGVRDVKDKMAIIAELRMAGQRGLYQERNRDAQTWIGNLMTG